MAVHTGDWQRLVETGRDQQRPIKTGRLYWAPPQRLVGTRRYSKGSLETGTDCNLRLVETNRTTETSRHYWRLHVVISWDQLRLRGEQRPRRLVETNKTCLSHYRRLVKNSTHHWRLAETTGNQYVETNRDHWSVGKTTRNSDTTGETLEMGRVSWRSVETNTGWCMQRRSKFGAFQHQSTTIPGLACWFHWGL